MSSPQMIAFWAGASEHEKAQYLRYYSQRLPEGLHVVVYGASARWATLGISKRIHLQPNETRFCPYQLVPLVRVGGPSPRELLRHWLDVFTPWHSHAHWYHRDEVEAYLCRMWDLCPSPPEAPPALPDVPEALTKQQPSDYLEKKRRAQIRVWAKAQAERRDGGAA